MCHNRRGKICVLIAQLINADSEEIALTKNTSEGIIAIAQSLMWRTGDKIILLMENFFKYHPLVTPAKNHLIPIFLSKPQNRSGPK